MKKELAALALACALIPGVSMAADKLPSSEKLMNDYDKYVVVYTSDDERIYADADTIRCVDTLKHVAPLSCCSTNTL